MDNRSDLRSKCASFPHAIGQEIRALRQNVLNSNLIDFNELYDAEFKHFLNWKRQTDGIPYATNKELQGDGEPQQQPRQKQPKQQQRQQQHFYGTTAVISMGAILCMAIGLLLLNSSIVTEYFTSIRCFVPNNYMVWEATRPIFELSILCRCYAATDFIEP